MTSVYLFNVGARGTNLVRKRAAGNQAGQPLGSIAQRRYGAMPRTTGDGPWPDTVGRHIARPAP